MHRGTLSITQNIKAVFGWLGLIFMKKSTVGWLVLVLCVREILLPECSEDEANRV